MVIIALLLVVGVIFGAMYYVKSTLAKRVPQSGFDNPAYQSAAGAVTIDGNPPILPHTIVHIFAAVYQIPPPLCCWCPLKVDPREPLCPHLLGGAVWVARLYMAVNPAGAGDKSGYMDIPYSFQNEKAAKVPPASAQATGYMDVAPGGFQDDDEEEDV